MRIERASSLGAGAPVATYGVPPMQELLARSRETWGEQYDRVERKMVAGGLPTVMQLLNLSHERSPDAFPEARKTLRYFPELTEPKGDHR